jgi:hypothetical protein
MECLGPAAGAGVDKEGLGKIRTSGHSPHAASVSPAKYEERKGPEVLLPLGGKLDREWGASALLLVLVAHLPNAAREKVWTVLDSRGRSAHIQIKSYRLSPANLT